ncbi:hypothetical protein BTS2_2016 [Bacillus sp. TS-2]|nr:hypothetical protein BTS2_2016 [Bacillus sp. TS-2]
MISFFSNWFKTDTEIKRDDYLELYRRLQNSKSELDRRITEAENYYSSYLSSMPFLSIQKLPSKEFYQAKESLEAKASQYIQREKNKRSDLTIAENRAYNRYLHYKNLAIREAEKNK